MPRRVSAKSVSRIGMPSATTVTNSTAAMEPLLRAEVSDSAAMQKPMR